MDEDIYYKVSHRDLLALAHGAAYLTASMLGGSDPDDPTYRQDVWDVFDNLTDEDYLVQFERIG